MDKIKKGNIKMKKSGKDKIFSVADQSEDSKKSLEERAKAGPPVYKRGKKKTIPQKKDKDMVSGEISVDSIDKGKKSTEEKIGKAAAKKAIAEKAKAVKKAEASKAKTAKKANPAAPKKEEKEGETYFK